MNTILQIEIKDGRFVELNNQDVKYFSANYIETSKWRCRIEPCGEIFCTSVEECNGERYRLKFKIEADGMVKHSLKSGNKNTQTWEYGRLTQWPTDGVICLPSSFMDGHKPYFREDSFQNFLNKYGITSVWRETANGSYCLEEETYNRKRPFSETIETDGKMLEIIDIFDYPGKGNAHYFWRYREVEVSNAKWVIKTIIKNGEKQRILITRENLRKIEGLLPKPV